MSSAPPSVARAAFDKMSAKLVGGDVAINMRRGFSNGGLMHAGKLVAILRGEALLLKLPAQRVAHLIANHREASPFDAGKGRPMREWVLVGLEARAQWLKLTREALEYAQS